MDCIHIENSYRIPKKDFGIVLLRKKVEFPDSGVWKRSQFSLFKEWATHNGLYALGLWRSHTKDVDLEYPQKWYLSILYGVCGCIFWPFIK